MIVVSPTFRYIVLGILFMSVTAQEDEQPIMSNITPGGPCEEGRAYNMDCNMCFCGANNFLTCTQMACFDGNRRKGSKSGRKDLAGSKCSPGEIRDHLPDCQFCYCNFRGTLLCMILEKIKCRKRMLKLTKNSDFIDISPMFEENVETLPILPHSAAECEPGKSYQIECNSCFCSSEKNLICTRIYCFSLHDAHERDAFKLSGAACKEGDAINYNCVVCKCQNGVLDCDAEYDCVTATEQKFIEKYLENGKTLDVQPDESNCIPDAIYRLDCNKCYCQKDRTLRCTTMSCLNYEQSRGVQQLISKLEKLM